MTVRDQKPFSPVLYQSARKPGQASLFSKALEYVIEFHWCKRLHEAQASRESGPLTSVGLLTCLKLTKCVSAFLDQDLNHLGTSGLRSAS